MGKIKDLMSQAENDLQEYLDKWEEDNGEINVEAPVYFMELRQCKTVKEIVEYMKEFGWEKNNTKDKIKVLSIQELKDLNESVNHFNLNDAIERLRYLESNIKITYYCCGKIINPSAIKHFHGYIDRFGHHHYGEDYFCSYECVNTVKKNELEKEDVLAIFRWNFRV